MSKRKQFFEIKAKASPEGKSYVAIKAAANDASVLELYFLDVISDSYDWYTGNTYSQVQEIIDKINSYQPSKIKSIIDSIGGDAQVAISVYNLLKRVNAKVECEIIGMCASAATVIAMAANKGKLTIARNGFFMIHRASGIAKGTSDDLRETADVIDKYTDQMIDIYSQRTGKTSTEIAALFANGDYWMTGVEAKEQGWVDDTFNDAPDLQVAARFDQESYNKIPIKIRAQMSGAPKTEGENDLTNIQSDNMKKILGDFLAKFKSEYKPTAGADASTVAAQLIEQMQAPFEQLETHLNDQVTSAVTAALAEHKPATPAAIDFAADGAPKAALDSAVTAAVTAALKPMTDQIAALTTANGDLKTANDNLEKDITAIKGKETKDKGTGEGGFVAKGKFNKG